MDDGLDADVDGDALDPGANESSLAFIADLNRSVVASPGVFARIPANTWALLRIVDAPQDYERPDAYGASSTITAWLVPGPNVTGGVHMLGNWRQATNEFSERISMSPFVHDANSTYYFAAQVGYSGAAPARTEWVLLVYYEGGDGVVGISRTGWNERDNATEVEADLRGAQAAAGAVVRIVDGTTGEAYEEGAIEIEGTQPTPGDHTLTISGGIRLSKTGFVLLEIPLATDSVGVADWGYTLVSAAGETSFKSRAVWPLIGEPEGPGRLWMLNPVAEAVGDVSVEFSRHLVGAEGLSAVEPDVEWVEWMAADADLAGVFGWPLAEHGQPDGTPQPVAICRTTLPSECTGPMIAGDAAYQTLIARRA